MSAEIDFPKLYRGIYHRTQPRYGPLIADAVERLRKASVPRDLRPFLGYMVWENPQPSFILLPFMYLATADASGGITRRHEEFLPAIMLTAELCAVADDTVDRSAQRSDRPTFPARFGDPSSVPMAGALLSMILERAHPHPELFEATTRFWTELFTLELWEREHTYPEQSLFATWLEHRYGQAIVTTEYVLNSARILSEQPVWPHAAAAAFSQIGQDVDDIVNLVEYRESLGENDDLQSGIVTRALIYAVHEVPELAADVEELWSQYRPLSALHLTIPQLQERRAELNQATLPLYARIRRVILEKGVPLAVRQCVVEYHDAVRCSPPALQPLMRDLAMSFLDRLRRCRYVAVGGGLEAPWGEDLLAEVG